METLVADGLVRSIGLSNYEREDIARCHEQRSVDVIQNGLSIIDHLDEQDTIAWCGDQGIAATIYEPIGSGVLSDTPLDEVREHWVGTPWEDTPFFRRMFSPATESRTRRVVEGVRKIAEEVGVPTSQVALAWVLRQPGVTSAIAGSRNPDRARSNSLAADVDLSDAAVQALNDLIPLGPSFV
jgi:aryl-alcohol dehydrogenase-like predicted oxidoreductase